MKKCKECKQMKEKEFDVGDLVFVYEFNYEDSLGIIVEVCSDGWYYYYKINNKLNEIEFNNYYFDQSKFEGVYIGRDENFRLIEKGNTKI